ncbi:hypothetical protein EMCRGX_G018989 [Ephydatia muelleri]
MIFFALSSTEVPQPTVASVNPVAIGINATLTCTIDDVLRGANVSYQWTKNGVPLSGRTQANLNFINVGIVDQGAYGCGISVGGVSNSSTTVSLTIIVPQPTVASVNPVAIGTNATLTCTIDDVLRGANVSYQWTKNGVPLSGRTQANLNFINVGIVDQGAYGCGISVGGVSNSSTTVSLTIIGEEEEGKRRRGRGEREVEEGRGGGEEEEGKRRRGRGEREEVEGKRRRGRGEREEEEGKRWIGRGGEEEGKRRRGRGETHHGSLCRSEARVPQPTVASVNPVAIGINATLTCTIDDVLRGANVSYQWTKNGVPLSGRTQANLNFINVGIVDQGAYGCGISVGGVSNSSTTVSLTIIVPQPTVASVNPVAIGTNATLTSTIDDVLRGANVSYQWTKNGVPLSGRTQANLNIINVGIVDQGAYGCGISVGGVSISSTTVNLTIFVPQPTITSINPVAIGTNATLTCTIDDVLRGANVSYQWTKNGVPLSGSTQANLNIINVGIVDQGAYGCGISVGGVSNSSTTVSLTIIVPQPTVASVNPVAIGTNATLTSTIDDVLRGANVSYQWTKNGVPLSGRTQANLNIINVGIVDQGAYGCGISVGGVSISSTTVNLTIFVPQPTVASVNPVAIGTNATLTCTIDDVLRGANVSYQWTKNGVPLPGSTQANLNIINVGIVDQGACGCGISVGGVSNSSTTVNLTIIGPSFVVSLNNMTTVLLNTNFVLRCVASSPSPTLVPSWTFPAAANATGGVTIVTVTQEGVVNSTLIVTSVGSGGGGVYTCAFTSRLPEDGINSSTTVVVLGPPQITGFPGDNVTMATANATQSSSYTMKCSVAPGVTPPLLTLSLQKVLPNGTSIQLNTTISSTSVSFTLQSPLLSDTGVYSCIATNAIGNDTKQLTLIVQAPPDPVNNLTITRALISFNLIRITWSPPASNNAPITSYIVTYCVCDPATLETLCPVFGPETPAVTSMTSADIAPLALNRVYRVSLVAVNSVGNSSAAYYYMNTTTSDDITPLNFTTVFVSTSDIIVTWSLSPLNVFTADSFPVQLTSFTLCFSRVASTLGQCLVIPSIPNQYQWNATGNLTGVSTDSPPDRYLLALNLTANYSNPFGSSSPAVVTVNVTSVAVSNIQATPSVNPVSNTVAFSWDSLVPATQRPFISQYLFHYSVTTLYTMGQRGRRQSSFSLTSTVSTTGTSTTVPRAPYSQYSYQVSAMYASGFTAPITGISSFNTSDYQTAAGPPQNLRVGTGSTYSTIPLEWSVPTAPNGAISRYTLTVTTPNTSPFSITLPSTTFSYSVSGLKGYTTYTITMAATNGFGSGTPSQVTSTTPYAVCTPSLQLSSVGTSFTVTIATSDLCGPLSYYRVIVGMDSNVPPSGLTYWSSQTQFNVDRYYVLYINDVVASGNNTVSFTFTQTLTQATYNNVMYSIVAPEPGTYFLTVLLYSMVDKAVFSSSDSVTFSPSVAPGSSMVTGAIAGAVIGGILSLLVVVAVILIIMTLRSKRKGRLSIGGNSLDTSIKKGKSQDMELTSIDVTENVSYERVHVPEDRVIYDTITDGAVDLKRPHPPPANEGDMYIEAATPPYSNFPSPSLPLPAFNSSVLPPSLPSPSYHHPPVPSSSPLSSPPPSSTPSTLPLQSGFPQPPFHHHTQPISVASFHDHVHTMYMNGNKGFQSEYRQLSDVKPEGASQTVASLACNARKNRFGNIVPCDENRVKLKETPGVPGSDYINASHIDHGYSYIASQGPKENTIADFWRMIWEKHIETIVMLAKCTEAGKNLCKQYWADEEGGVYDTDILCITTTSVVTLADYNIRSFDVKSKVVEDLDVLQVTHYQYTSWPDDEVPQFATSFLNFVRRVQKVHDKSKGVPLLVHCSTGVGRTGTFIALDTLLDTMRSETSISVFEVVKDMRRRRVLMVQTLAQYVFIHDALDEYITCGDTSISVTNLRVSINSLSKTKSGKTFNGFQKQFSLLDMVSRRPSPDECSDGAQPYNKAKNRYQNKLPYNASRPLLTMTGTEGSDYINASFIDGYKQCKGYIATQGPLQNTVEDFWRMVWEFKCRVIIMLCPLTEGHESSYCYWPTEEEMAASYGSISVTLQSQLYDGYEVRTFNINHKSEEQDIVVTQLHYTEWPENGRPPNTASMVELMDTLTRTQMSTGNKPIVVHCNDGVGRTGTFITMHSELERLKAEGALDVFQRVNLCRIARPGLVQNVDQYVYCHEFLAQNVN